MAISNIFFTCKEPKAYSSYMNFHEKWLFYNSYFSVLIRKVLSAFTVSTVHSNHKSNKTVRLGLVDTVRNNLSMSVHLDCWKWKQAAWRSAEEESWWSLPAAYSHGHPAAYSWTFAWQISLGTLVSMLCPQVLSAVSVSAIVTLKVKFPPESPRDDNPGMLMSTPWLMISYNYAPSRV